MLTIISFAGLLALLVVSLIGVVIVLRVLGEVALETAQRTVAAIRIRMSTPGPSSIESPYRGIGRQAGRRQPLDPMSAPGPRNMGPTGLTGSAE